MRKYYMSSHVFWGVVIFVLGVATSFTGITEKAFFSVKNPSYSALPPEGEFAEADFTKEKKMNNGLMPSRKYVNVRVKYIQLCAHACVKTVNIYSCIQTTHL